MLKNPLRLLDCKDEKCQEIKKGAPGIIDDLCSSCSKHLRGVLEYVEVLKIPYQIDPFIVRGLDYYNGTVFEVFSGVKSSDGEIVLSPALGGGGRYDGLSKALGKGNTYAVGAALGIERIIETIKATGVTVPIKKKKSVFLITIGAEAKKKGIGLLEDFVKAGVNIKESMGKNSLSAQLRAADKLGATWALILGQKEVFKDTIILRNLKTGAQETIFVKNVMAKIKRKL